MLAWYRLQLARRPLLTQAATTAVLFATGDALAQHAVERRPLSAHDNGRTIRMLGYGGLVFGPAATLWYGFLQRSIKLPGRPNLEIVAKVLADQTVFATANMGLFLSSMAVLEGADPGERLARSYVPGLMKNWLVWPPVQFVNFKYVPLEQRVLVVNVVALGWNCYLSWLNAGSGGGDEGASEEGEKIAADA